MKPMLDNPAWWALNTHHADFAQGTAQAKRYRKDILAFIATGSTADAAPEIEVLGEADAAEMFQLINSRQPGYYNLDTWRLGSYYGIRREGRLVAMAGERLRMTGFSELSAICTDADHTGKGYAHALIWHICRIQAQAGITPFLHVSLSNQRAVSLYEHMGFIHRREISFWRCRKE